MNGSNGNPTAIQGSQVGVVLPDQDPIQLVQKGGVTKYGETVWADSYNLLNSLLEGAKEVDFMKWAENDMKIKSIKVDEMKLTAQIKTKEKEKIRNERKAGREWKKIQETVFQDSAHREYLSRLDIFSNSLKVNDLEDTNLFGNMPDLVRISDTGAEYNTLEDRKFLEEIEKVKQAGGFEELLDLADRRNDGGLINE